VQQMFVEHVQGVDAQTRPQATRQTDIST
jgi:hypothetical protein